MGKYNDVRERMIKYNKVETAVRNDSELLKISNSVKGKAIYCHEFDISKETMSSLKNNDNFVIGTGVDAKLLIS